MILLPQPPVAGITVVHNHAWLIFVFLVETGSHHAGHTGLELLTSGRLPTSASQSAGITGVSHRAQPDDDSILREKLEERTPLPGQCRECGGRHIFRRVDQFWDTNTSNLLYGLQNAICVLQVDTALRVKYLTH